jgi:ABC-type polysaccharide/polyol phosphate export permease
LMASPAPRWTILTGMALSASARALIPAALVLAVALALGATFPGVAGLLIAAVLVMGMAAVAAFWGMMLALRYRSQSAAPLMQSGMFLLVLLTPAYAPIDLLQGWLHKIATINPVTKVMDAMRQGFLGGVTWSGTWPGLLAIAVLLLLLGGAALRGMNRFSARA